MGVTLGFSRFAISQIEEAITDTPVIVIHGPRQCGKTTLAKQLIPKGYHYLSFDDATLQASAITDPMGFVNSLPEKIILDEIQRVPSLFSAIKLSVDENRQAGRFILTGSANILLLPKLSDSLAGRMEVIRLHPLALAERVGIKPNYLQQWFDGDFLYQHPAHPSQGVFKVLAEHLNTLLLQGGFPEAVQRSSTKRRKNWYKNYINAIVMRDVQDLAKIRQFDAIPKLLKASATQTATLFNISSLSTPFSLSQPTIAEYTNLLEKIFLIERLAPFHSNLLKRMVKTPKLHVTDTGLVLSLLEMDEKTLPKNPEIRGQVLETFVFLELQKWASWMDEEIHFFHFRNKDKLEVDIMLQQEQQFIGIEIKSAQTVQAKDFKGLIKLKNSLQGNFMGGIVFYDGARILPFGDKLYAMPLDILTMGLEIS